MRFDLKYLEQLKADGKIRGFTQKKVSPPAGQKSKNEKKRGDKIKAWIELNLTVWAEANKLKLVKEYRFDPERRWQLDWSIPSKKIAWEYEGLASQKNGHTSKKGYTANTDKYNELSAQGWRLIRYTYMNYKQMINDLNRLL